METNFLTYFTKRNNVAAEKPILDPSLPSSFKFYGHRLVAPTVPSVTEEDARASNLLAPTGKLPPSIFNKLLQNGPKHSTRSVYAAARLRSGIEVCLDSVQVEDLVYRRSASLDGPKIVMLFAWLGDIALEMNAVDFLIASPHTSADVAHRAIVRVCQDRRFKEDYRNCAATATTQMLELATDAWDFKPDTVGRNGFIKAIRNEVSLLVEEGNILLVKKLREMAKEIVAKAKFDGLCMSQTVELPLTVSSEALTILRKIGRDMAPGVEKNDTLLVGTGKLIKSGTHHLYRCDAVRELTNILLLALGLQNVARGMSYVTHGRSSEFASVNSPPTVSIPVKLPVACMAIPASMLEGELRILYQKVAHFGIRMIPVSTLGHFSNEERKIILDHRRILSLAIVHKKLGPNHPPAIEFRELANVVEKVINVLDKNLDITNLNKLLESQQIRLSPWDPTERFY